MTSLSGGRRVCINVSSRKELAEKASIASHYLLIKSCTLSTPKGANQ